jgi:hypothetical protein
VHYGESTAAERYQLLQKIRFIAKNVAKSNQDVSKDNFDKHALPHSFNIDDLVWYEDFAPLGKNPKLTPKWSGPAKITEINDTNARILLPNGKSKVLNVMRLKKFFSDKSDSQKDSEIIPETLDFNAEPKISGPMTRAMKKLLDHKNAAQLAINVLCDLSKKHCAMCEWEQECSDNPLLFDPNFAKQFIKERQSWLINKQSICAKCKLQCGQQLVDNQAQNDIQASNSIHQQCHHFNQNSHSSENDVFPFQEFNSNELIKIQNALRAKNNLINEKSDHSVTNNQNLINTNDDISLINETLREPLLHIANKLLGRQNLNFDQLTPPEQKLWNLFENSDIYEFLTGEKDTLPEFRHNWITCSAKPKVTFDYQGFINSWTALNQLPQLQPAVQRALSDPSPIQHNLRERKKKINYRALHLGQELKQVSQELNSDLQQAAQQIKAKCKSMRKSVRKSAKATVTKLTPGAFSPKPTPHATAPSSPATTSSSSWNFWSSK